MQHKSTEINQSALGFHTATDNTADVGRNIPFSAAYLGAGNMHLQTSAMLWAKKVKKKQKVAII